MTACQTTQIPRTEVPSVLRIACTRPDGADDVKTIGDLASYSIRQDAALKVCDAKRAGAVDILDAINSTPKGGWWSRFKR